MNHKSNFITTSNQYLSLWNKYFSTISKVIIPNYDEFEICNRMLEDYLDIFRGYNSRPESLKMPYPHPFFDINEKPLLSKIPTIRYVLVGEVRRPTNKSITNDCTPISGDLANTYFYDIRHLKSTSYLFAPRINWNCPVESPCPINKVETLLCLASKGVLLLDLFPFAISLDSDLRRLLNNSGATKSFWNVVSNPYSLEKRIDSIKSLLRNDWDLSMVAPAIISEFIVNPANDFPILSIIPAGLHPTTFRDISSNSTRNSLGNQWRKIAVTSAGSPSASLIRLSF